MTAKVLIVDGNAASRIVMTVKLSAACHSVTQTARGSEAIAAARHVRPDIILSELTLPDMTGPDLCRSLRADPGTRDIPLLFLTACPDADLRCAILRAGADALITKPVGEAVLLALIRRHLRSRGSGITEDLPGTARSVLGLSEDGPGYVHAVPATTRDRRAVGAGSAPGPAVVLIAGDPAMARGWRVRLSAHLDEPMRVMTRVAALAQSGAQPDLYLIAADLAGDGDGLRLLSDLRARPGSQAAAVVVALNGANDLQGAMALDLGAADLVHCDFSGEETALRLRQHLSRKRAADRMRAGVRVGLNMAMTDPLTGLHNRRYAMADLERLLGRQHGSTANVDTGLLAVMMIDLDRFKTVNDLYGHVVGDRVLAEVARRLRRNLRQSDLIARIGGEEFLFAGPVASPAEAIAMAERLRQCIGAEPIVLPDDRAVPVTASIGLGLHDCHHAQPGDDPAQSIIARLLEQADRALLRAKAIGRDRVQTLSAADPAPAPIAHDGANALTSGLGSDDTVWH